jgi:hypothetical protein
MPVHAIASLSVDIFLPFASCIGSSERRDQSVIARPCSGQALVNRIPPTLAVEGAMPSWADSIRQKNKVIAKNSPRPSSPSRISGFIRDRRRRVWRKCSSSVFFSGRCGSLHHLIFERHTIGIVLLQPCFHTVQVCEYLEVVGVTDFFCSYRRKSKLSFVPLELSLSPIGIFRD